VIKEDDMDVFERGSLEFRKLLYGAHPYAFRDIGEESSINKITREDILDFYHKHFVPENAVITVVGNIDAQEVLSKLEARFSSWGVAPALPVGRQSAESIAHNAERREYSAEDRESDAMRHAPCALLESQNKDIILEKEEALVITGFRGVRLDDKRKYALSVISSILSGSDGALFYTMREEEGLVYASGAMSMPEVEPGYFLVYAATTEEKIEKVKDKVFGVIKKIASGDITDEDISSAKNCLISGEAYSLETNYALSMRMALDELYGLGFGNYKEYSRVLASLTKSDIVRCAKEILDMSKCVTVTIHSKR